MRLLTRREFLKYAGGVVTLSALTTPLLAGCQTETSTDKIGPVPAQPLASGSIEEYKLMAAVTPVNLGTGEFQAWTYNGSPVGPEIRVTEGDTLRVTLVNNLPDPTTIHWHGVPVPNPMDGVPDMPLPPVQPGETFTYEFTAWPSGTYWYHPHVGYQLDQGLVGPLIIEPKQESGKYDREYTLVLDDWVTVDGGGPAATERRPSSMMGGMMSPAWTINGKAFPETDDLVIKLGQRVRLNYVNHSPMPHPMHLHGHFFEVVGSPGLRKDTLMVEAHMGQASIEFITDNPGDWMHHCHHLYHMEAGMMNVIRIS